MKVKPKTLLYFGALAVLLAVVFAGVSYADCGFCKTAKTQAKTAGSAGEQPELNTAALATLIRAKAPFVLLDARTDKWYDGKRIPGAQRLTFEASVREIAAVIPHKHALIVAYCGSPKCPLSHKLAHRLSDLGYTNVIEYRAGVAGWKAAGLKFEKAR